jgi:hypothetical protein
LDRDRKKDQCAFDDPRLAIYKKLAAKTNEKYAKLAKNGKRCKKKPTSKFDELKELF